MTPLERIIRAQIAQTGPLSVADYMRLSLGHPEHGYYIRKDPLGAEGDFTTAPEISQMFGELIGLWLVAVWMDQGRPDPFRLVELGPGRGALMADILRAAGRVPDFVAAADIWLVETSPVLRRLQSDRVVPTRPNFASSLQDVPPGPILLIANEFFDALPIRQYVHQADGWRERVIGLKDDTLTWGLGPPALLPAERWRNAATGAIAEICPEGEAVAAEIGRRLDRQGGGALIIDYGYSDAEARRAGGADTLQAMRRHRFADPLHDPGEADLTAHVDFDALARAASPASASPLAMQGDFLRALGIDQRAKALATAAPDRAADIASQHHRLTAPEEMGILFRVLGLSAAGRPPLPGFSSPDAKMDAS